MSIASRRITRISMATTADRPAIYAMRHDVYAAELGQHPMNPDGRLSDALDEFNEYIVAHVDGELAAFISITPPGFGRYSIDKYAARQNLPVCFDDGLYEERLLTVAEPHRRSKLAGILMCAAFRWIEERGGRRILIMGRKEVVGMYRKFGLRLLNFPIQCGSVHFELMETDVAPLRTLAERRHKHYRKLLKDVEWELNFPFAKAACCFHGGAFFEAIGAGFETLERRQTIINADVLDAWFPPSPKVMETLEEHLPWLARTSPPAQCDGMKLAIARARGVSVENILPAAGSSHLIYLAFQRWLNRDSRVLILAPSYGEYAHVLTNVIGCQVDRMVLPRSSGYAVDLEQLRARMCTGYDLIVLVNPNNPTGRHIPRVDLQSVLQEAPMRTRVWIDEAYLEYVGPNESMEQFAAQSENVLVAKSMSKVYALSGMRAAYLCGPVHQLSELIPWTPPWAVSLVAQVAAVRALEDDVYYAGKYAETHRLREQLVAELRGIGLTEIVPGTANFVMFNLRPEHPAVETVIGGGRASGVYLRDVSSMGVDPSDKALRIAVKDPESNRIVLESLEKALCAPLRI